MGDLESYLEQHANMQPDKGIAVSEHISRVEYFCSENLDLFQIDASAYRNILIRDDETGQTFGRISFASTDPTLSLLKVVSRNSYQRDPKLYKTAFINSAEYLSLRFNKVIKATLMTCDPIGSGYTTVDRNWVFNGKEILCAPGRTYIRRMYLTLKMNRLVRGRQKDLKTRLEHRD